MTLHLEIVISEQYFADPPRPWAPLTGTGMLNYPRRDCAAIALEEVKQFLESIDESNPIEKIVLVVSRVSSLVVQSIRPSY